MIEKNEKNGSVKSSSQEKQCNDRNSVLKESNKRRRYV
jgi:hypothetical protein